MLRLDWLLTLVSLGIVPVLIGVDAVAHPTHHRPGDRHARQGERALGEYPARSSAPSG